MSILEILTNLTDLNALVSSLNFAILACKLPKLIKVEVLLCEEAHLAIVADRCPNIKVLALRLDPRVAFGSLYRMDSIGNFTNLVILDILCGELVPQLSTLHNLRELVLFTTRRLTGKRCALLCSEIPKSVRFLSLDSITAAIAEIVLANLELTVLRVNTTPSAFAVFRKTFKDSRGNPKHLAVKSGTSYLWNGTPVRRFGGSFFFRRRYLTCP